MITEDGRKRVLQGIQKSHKIHQAKYEERQQQYLLCPKKCSACGFDLSYKQRKNCYCSKICAAKVNIPKIPKKKSSKVRDCRNCGADTKNPKFCSLECQSERRYKDNVRKWLSGEISGGTSHKVADYVKRYLLEKRGAKCEICGWCERHPVTGNFVLQFHHIDGPESHREEDIQILCPNHHAMTSTYGALNKGNGRTYRRRNQEQTQI